MDFLHKVAQSSSSPTRFEICVFFMIIFEMELAAGICHMALLLEKLFEALANRLQGKFTCLKSK